MESVFRTRDLGLCVSCEICTAVCPEKAIEMEFESGSFVPVIDSGKCNGCGLCLKLCPGIDLDPMGIRHSEDPEKVFTGGEYAASYSVRSRNLDILLNSASGGVVTTLLLDLIKRERYSRAFVLDYTKFDGKPARLAGTDNPEKITAAAKSKYIPASVYNVINALDATEDEKIIIVGTPCQISGIRKYMKFKGIPEERVLLIGLFCELIMNFNIYRYFENTYGRNGEKIKSFMFKSKERSGWPGDVKIIFDSGREIFIDKSRRMEAKEFFQMPRCLLCLDKLNRNADISVGDCYVRGKESWSGMSNVLIRTELGERAFSEAEHLFVVEPENARVIEDSQGLPVSMVRHLESLKYFMKKHGLENEPNVSFRPPIGAGRKLERSIGRIRRSSDDGVATVESAIKKRKYLKKLKSSAGNLVIYIAAAGIFAGDLLVGLLRNTVPFIGAYKKNCRKGVLITGVNFNNKGSQAMAFAALDIVRKVDPDVDVYILSGRDYRRPDAEKDLFNFKIVDWRLHDLIKSPLLMGMLSDKGRAERKRIGENKTMLKSLRLIVDVSGYNLSSLWPLLESLLYSSRLLLAKIHGIPYVVMPQSIGPFDYGFPDKLLMYPLLRLVLKCPEKIFIRERAGMEYIKKYTERNVEKTMDMVLEHPDRNIKNIFCDGFEPLSIDIADGTVGIVPSIMVSSRVDEEALIDLYTGIIDLLESRGKAVLIFRHSYEDLDLCMKLKRRYADNPNVRLVTEDLSAPELEQLIGGLDFIVTSRYHSVIHAYNRNVPALVIGWAFKYQELMSDFDQLNYHFSIKDGIDMESIMSAAERMIRHRQEESVKIKRHKADLLHGDNCLESAVSRYL